MIQYLKKKSHIIPLFGIGLYVIFFLVAASMFTGGSYGEFKSNSYDHFNNFLCDLMLTFSDDGKINYARPVAVVGHLLLGIGMMAFFYTLPKIFIQQNRNTKFIRNFGMMAMFCFLFMVTDYHDVAVTATGVFGIAAMIPLFIECLRVSEGFFRYYIFFCIAISLYVFFSYETKFLIGILPFIQKIAFIVDSIWVIGIASYIADKRLLNNNGGVDVGIL